MSEPSSRRNFLRGRFSPRKSALRPPWAIPEEAFLEACTRCGECIRACPSHIVIDHDAGYPSIDFGAGECTFCGDCVTACKSGALRQRDEQPPWMVSAAIDENCLAQQRVECRVCGDLCPTGIIRFKPQLGGISAPRLDRERCTGCGACVAACPTRAIKVG